MKFTSDMFPNECGFFLKIFLNSWIMFSRTELAIAAGNTFQPTYCIYVYSNENTFMNMKESLTGWPAVRYLVSDGSHQTCFSIEV